MAQWPNGCPSKYLRKYLLCALSIEAPSSYSGWHMAIPCIAWGKIPNATAKFCQNQGKRITEKNIDVTINDTRHAKYIKMWCKKPLAGQDIRNTLAQYKPTRRTARIASTSRWSLQKQWKSSWDLLQETHSLNASKALRMQRRQELFRLCRSFRTFETKCRIVPFMELFECCRVHKLWTTCRNPDQHACDELISLHWRGEDQIHPPWSHEFTW